MIPVYCRWCDKTEGEIIWYNIPDDIEYLLPYHPKCYKQMVKKALIMFMDQTGGYSND